MPIEKTADKGIPAERRKKTADAKARRSKEASEGKPKDYLADMSDKVKTAKA